MVNAQSDRVLGVDGNWYLHRIFHTQQFEPRDEQVSQAKRFLSLICKDAGAVKAKRILVAFDGWSIFRYKVYNKYKANRENSGSSGVYDHLQYLKDYLGLCGIPVVHLKQYEADDVLCSLGTQYKNVIIGCRDKDAYQYVSSTASLYDSSAKPTPKKIGVQEIKDVIGLSPNQCCDYQTLVGDKIDNIPQLMRPAEAKIGLHEWGSIKKWATKDGVFRVWCRDNVDQLNINRKLVRLISTIPIEVSPIKWNSEELVTRSYLDYKAFADSKSKGLF
jgi:5'-3' exonuclease